MSDHVDGMVLTRYAIYLCDPQQADYDGHKLTDKELIAVAKHVEGCAQCRARVEAIRDQWEVEGGYVLERGIDF